MTVTKDIDAVEAPLLEAPVEAPSAMDAQPPMLRAALAVAFPLIAASIMIGGVFTGIGGRVYACVAALAGLGLAATLARTRRPALANVGAAFGLFLIGVLLAAPSGIEAVTGLRTLVVEAARSGDVLRPPVDLTPGWQAIVGWLMGTAGFVAGWVALVVDRPPFGVLLPVPLAGIGGISVPTEQQVGSGIAVLVLLAIGLALLSSSPSPDGHTSSVRYELRVALRGIPVVGAIVVVLIALSRASFLFPHPIIDPTLEPQKPKTTPISEVEDRILFEVTSTISGPWRIGTLDVYDGNDWLLAPFSEARTKEVPPDGVVDDELDPGVKAEFTVAGMTGAVLPGLPNAVGIVAEGRFVYDARTAAIRLAQGQLLPGMTYTIAASSLPSQDQLRRVTAPVPAEVERFMDIPEPPAAVRGLLDQAPDTSRWDTFAFLHAHILETVTAVGQGVPVSVPPDRVQDMLAGSKEGSPFEIVAAEAMLARWAGIPSRIAYGFDGGDLVDDKLHVRPRHGSTFIEIYFPGFKWLPVIATPQKAKASVGDRDEQQVNPTVLPSEDIAVELFLPVVVAPPSTLTDNVRRGVAVVGPALLLGLLSYIAYPLVAKAIRRARRRTAAQDGGPRARIALAYAEWRDAITDFGYPFPSDTPLMLLDRFGSDPEHTELAWLVTRTLWGDLRASLSDEMAVSAEELARALRRRLSQAHPATMRVIAALSRQSMRHPFGPDTAEPSEGVRREPARVG